jgi:hypothetical protein
MSSPASRNINEVKKGINTTSLGGIDKRST